ncbi:MAG: 30S ribosomal protein S6e [Nanohaloarchaea archaeon]|nr:30S ribosomal protein S6e [Candidatus Nanohaloarchaea archaeon]
MKVTVGDNDGNTHQVETEESSKLAGKQIGETFDGGIIGLEGYELEITGGSDKQGFPMRKSIEGTGRRRILLDSGAGIDAEEKGERKRKSVRGNTVSDAIEQLNTTVVDEGSESIEELLSEDEE